MSHVYVDPAGPHYRPPNLIAELTRFHATKTAVPEENQMTAALAWLLDRSQVFAREFATLFVGADVLDGVTRFGTQTQVSLPNPSGKGLLWPDLSLAGDASSFELLVEVKVGATPNEYPVGEQVLVQPDMYVEAWRLRPDATQAKVRRVGTLTKGFDFPPAHNPWRASDITWLEVRDLLRALLESSLEPNVARVAEDFCDVVGQVVLREPAVTAEHQAALLDSGRVVLARLRELLAGPVGASKPGQVGKFEDFVSLLLRPAAEFELWFFVTPAGGKYNRFGHPDTLGVRLTQPDEKLFKDEERVRAGGFTRYRDLFGYTDDRIYLPLENVDGVVSDCNAFAEHAASEVLAALSNSRPPFI